MRTRSGWPRQAPSQSRAPHGGIEVSWDLLVTSECAADRMLGDKMSFTHALQRRDDRLVIGGPYGGRNFIDREGMAPAARGVRDGHRREKLASIGVLRVLEHGAARPDLDDLPQVHH